MYRVVALGLVAACGGGHVAPDAADAMIGERIELHVTGGDAFDVLILLQANAAQRAAGPETPAMQARGEAAGDVDYHGIASEQDRTVSPPGTDATVTEAMEFDTLVLGMRDGAPVGVAEVTQFLANAPTEVALAPIAADGLELWGTGSRCARVTQGAPRPQIWAPSLDPDCDGIDSGQDCVPLVYCDRAHPTDAACSRATCDDNCAIGGDACDIGTAYECRDDGPAPFVTACAAIASCPQVTCQPEAVCTGVGAVACRLPRGTDGALCAAPETLTIDVAHTACSDAQIVGTLDLTDFTVAFAPGTCTLTLQVGGIDAATAYARLDYAADGRRESMLVDFAPVDDCAMSPGCAAVGAEAICDYDD